jgi:hypothetical protein
MKEFNCGCHVDLDGDGDGPYFEELCDDHRPIEVAARSSVLDRIRKDNGQ